jgi:hypothetical protein
MSEYFLSDGLFMCPTPAGAYFAVSADQTDGRRDFIRQLLLQRVTPALTLDNLRHLTGIDDPQKNYELLHTCQKLNWVQGLNAPMEYPSSPIGNILPDLLVTVSESGKALLADMQGFHLGYHGFSYEVAEDLSVISAELAILYERRSGVLVNELGITNQSWGIVDVFGNSQIGFWPLFIGKNLFVLVISGVPHFNRPEFLKLVWALSVRYAEKLV